MSAAAEHTDPTLRALPAPGRRRRVAWWQLTLAIAGGIVAVGQALAVLTGAGVLSAPWESREDASRVHAQIKTSIEEMRAEQKQSQGSVIEAINKLGDKLERKRR